MDNQTTTILWKVFPPIILCIGTFGNILSIIVLRRKSVRKFGISGLIICLAVSNLLVLYTGLLRQWIVYLFDTDIRDIHPALCKINTWLVYFSLDMSAWTLVAIIVERAVAVWWPLKFKYMCTRRVFVGTILVLAVVLMSVNSHFLVLYGGVQTGDVYQCECMDAACEHYMGFVFPWIDLFLFSLGPTMFQIIGSIFIIVGLCRRERTMAITEDARSERRREIFSVTRTLLLLSLVYIVSTLPVSVYLICITSWEMDQSPEAEAQRTFVYACVNLFMYMGSSINFIPCVVGGKVFREELWALLLRKSSKTKTGRNFFVKSQSTEK